MNPRNYSYKPEFRKRKMKWENTLCLGLEIELEHKNNNNDSRNSALEQVHKTLKNHRKGAKPFYYKEDSSLNNGIEFVAQPMTLQYIHNKVFMNRFFDTLLKNNFKESCRCGIHVHLSKSFFKPLELAKLRLFFSVNKAQLTKFSGRSIENISRWARLETYTVKDFLHKGKIRDGAATLRSSACSFRSNLRDKTVEMRLFASTTKHKRFVAITQFCDAISYFVLGVGTGAISKTDCWSQFVRWCEQQNRYNHLMEELENVNLAS